MNADAAALTALPSQFINGVKSCWADPSDTQLEFNQCMTTKSIATLEAINKGAGKDLPIAADLTAVLKAAKVYNVIIGAVNTSKKA
jgi:hypothetical protein